MAACSLRFVSDIERFDLRGLIVLRTFLMQEQKERVDIRGGISI